MVQGINCIWLIRKQILCDTGLHRQSSSNMRKQFSYRNESTDDSFNELQQPIMTPQYAPMDGFKFARDQYNMILDSFRDLHQKSFAQHIL